MRNSLSIQFLHHLFSDVFTVYNMCFCKHVHIHTTHTRLVSLPTGIFAARAILCVAFYHCKHSAIIFIPFRTKRKKGNLTMTPEKCFTFVLLPLLHSYLLFSELIASLNHGTHCSASLFCPLQRCWFLGH